MLKTSINIPMNEISAFCKKWKIAEFALFGSVLRDDFQPDSDIDVLVTFAPDAHISLFDLAVMEDELQIIFKRKVDLVEKAGLRNPFRRREILSNMEIIYAS